MDIQQLICMKHWLEYASFTFSLENYVILTNSLLVLQNENHFKKVFFWGIIQGLEADYFIAFGYMTDAITERKYFYSDDCQNWKLLPIPQRADLILTELCIRPFQGDPGLVIEVLDDAPLEELYPDQNNSILEETHTVSEVEDTVEQEGQEEQNEEEKVDEKEERKISQAKVDEEEERKISQAKVDEEEERKISQAKVDEEEERKISQVTNDLRESVAEPITSGELKEEDRVAAIVQIITEETAIVPRGGLFKQTDALSVHSQAFEGITLEDADSLCSFQHYRVPHNDCNTNLLSRCDYNYAIDFLDPIDKDVPADSWAAQLVEGDRTIVLRNLHWPGFMFFHYLNTPGHGFIYVGPGQRNLDIPFMTQVTLPIVETTEEIKPEELPEELRPSRVSRVSKLSRVSTVRPSKVEGEVENDDDINEIQDSGSIDEEQEINTSP